MWTGGSVKSGWPGSGIQVENSQWLLKPLKAQSLQGLGIKHTFSVTSFISFPFYSIIANFILLLLSYLICKMGFICSQTSYEMSDSIQYS